MTVTSGDVYAELSATLGAGAVGDPYPVFAQRRRETPVMVGDIMAEFGLPAMAQSLDGSRPMYTMFRYDDIAAALRNPEVFSSSVIMDVFEPLLGRVILGMDGPEHRAWRGLLTPAFARSLIETWQAEIMRPVARRLVSELAQSGHRANLFDFGLRFPVRMIYEILGFRAEGDAYDEFARAGLTMLLALTGVNPTKPEETARAVARAKQEADTLYANIHRVIEQRRAQGAEGNDLIGHLLRAEFEGQRLDDDQITIWVRSLLPAAAETTTRTWLNIMACMLERPDVVNAVRNDPGLIPAVITEGMRLEAATTVLGRICTREIEVRGVTIPAGAGITLAAAAGNRDEEVFEKPDEYDLTRTGPQALSFGSGPHVCVGQNTAKAEMTEAIRALLELLPNLRLDPDAPPPAIVGMMMRSPASLNVVWD